MQTLILICLSFHVCGLFGMVLIGKGKIVALSQPLLRSNIEMVDGSSFLSSEVEIDDALYVQVQEAMTSQKGRDSIDTLVKGIQRLQLQLDRSDGRSDITSDIIADKYYSFLSTCLRTEGGAWVAPLGPLQYVGYFIDKYVDTTGSAERRVIDVSGLISRMNQVLIDLPSDEAGQRIIAADASKQAHIQDLVISLIRLAVRFSIFKEILEGQPAVISKEATSGANFPFDVCIDCSTLDNVPSVCRLPVTDLDIVMQAEFLEQSSALVADNKVILPKEAVARFYKERFLE